ncbi:MAG: CoA transferase subunit A [Deltaproteobacteria bacterium]|nr:CoA transferase subunit A [Deltaproteobacteria bacterium]
MTAAQAVERFVQPGSQVVLGGFTVSRNPMHLTREIIRQGIGDLHLVVHSHGQAMDLLIGAGCVARLEIAYGGTGRFAPTCLCFRRAVAAGALEVEDYSNFQMSLRFLAGSLGIPFIPSRSGFGTDLIAKEGFGPATRALPGVANQKLIVQENPFDPTEKVVLLPALNPDVALLHAQYVGEDGTVRIKGLTFADVEQARAAKRVIVSCEEIVPTEFLRQDPDQNTLPPFMVDAVVLSPWGAHPTAAFYFYDYDPAHLRHYGQVARDEAGFQAYLAQWVHGPASQEAYLAQIPSTDLVRLRANPVTGYAPGLDRR